MTTNPVIRGDIVALEITRNGHTCFELARVETLFQHKNRGAAKTVLVAGSAEPQEVGDVGDHVKLWTLYAHQAPALVLFKATETPGIEYPDADAMRAAIAPDAPTVW